MKLDVGCGSKPRGHINVDNKRQAVPNFVLADAHALPFKDGVFSVVIASHVLEHVYSPLVALKEWKRVANGSVVILVPSKYVDDESVEHLYSWCPSTLRQICLLAFSKVHIYYTSRIYDLMWRLNVKTLIVNVVSKFLRLHTEMVAICE